MEESRFTYIVNPRRPIRDIPDMPTIKSSKTLKLTKEEALIAMKCGPVYRKFANEGIQERLSTANIDRLHNEKFISEREYAAMNTPLITDTAESVEEPDVEAPELDTEEAPNENDAVDNTKNEAPVEEVTHVESTGEVQSIETAENVEENTDESEANEAEASEEAVEEVPDSVAEENSEQNENNHASNITVDYSRKKKRHRN